jgi:hypothetical protein
MKLIYKECDNSIVSPHPSSSNLFIVFNQTVNKIWLIVFAFFLLLNINVIKASDGVLTGSHEKSQMNNAGWKDPGSGFNEKSVLGWIGLTALNTSSNSTQESYIIINPEATSGFDLLFDLEYLPGDGPMFYSLAGNEKLTTNSLPSLSAETEINFVFIPNQEGNFEITASGLDMIEEPVFLYDRISRADQNLSQSPVYSFQSLTGDDSARFVLHFGQTGIDNPLNGNSFKAFYYNGGLHFNTLGPNDFLVLSDMQGRILKQVQPGYGATHEYPIEMTPGIYILRLISGKESYVRRILVH